MSARSPRPTAHGGSFRRPGAWRRMVPLGRELFYVNRTDSLIALEVSGTPDFPRPRAGSSGVGEVGMVHERHGGA